MSGRATTLLICALLLGTVSPRAATDDLDDLLKQPVSPGTLGLLVTHTRDPRVGARWREALAHESPQVRVAPRPGCCSPAAMGLPSLIFGGCSSTGCVERLLVSVSATKEIDAEAIRAVSGWAFTPTIVKSVAVPVVMIVTLMFH